MWRLVQIAAGITPGDAITNEIELIHNRYQKGGGPFSSSLVVGEHIARGLNFTALSASRFHPDERDLILYHHSISTEVTDRLLSWKNRKILLYHNITPADFFRPYNLMIAGRLERGRSDLAKLSASFDGYFADSDFNGRELESLGFEPVRTLPVLFKKDRYQRGATPHDGWPGWNGAGPNSMTYSRADSPRILFVGRVVPNKNHVDLIKTHFYLNRIAPGSILTIAGGSFPGIPTYEQELKKLIQSLGLMNQIRFTGALSDEELFQEYCRADLFLCLSLHEGFCVPLLESFALGIPVLGYRAANSAVEETMGGCGVLVSDLDPPSIAEMILQIIEDPALRDNIIKQQSQRLESYQTEKIFSILEDSVVEWCGNG